MNKYYTDEENVLIVIALLKANGIRKVVASPGATNITFIGSIQNDPFFEVYSSVDERSAAYIACGLAYESNQPVVISCTGATSSQNYMPGLIEAYYRKLPILAITSTQTINKVGHHIAQVTDRDSLPNDTNRLSVQLPVVKDDDDRWECEVKTNQAILELTRAGGGPVHINLPTRYSRLYETKSLPTCRAIKRFGYKDIREELPELRGKVAVFIGAHKPFSSEETEALDQFCNSNNAVVFCDHSSAYNGKYRLQAALIGGQENLDLSGIIPEVTIHIGEVSGDYDSNRLVGKEVWRVNEDGEIRDTFRKLKYVFEMDETSFFNKYTTKKDIVLNSYFSLCDKLLNELREEIPLIPFSNIWVAQKTAHRVPENSTVHFGILNSLRSWNYFDLPKSVTSISNVGGFGIDGIISSLMGASLTNRDKLYFCILGDLAFFYDMNVLGNRHITNNLRIMIVNNGKGTEFRQYNHVAANFENQADEFIAAAGHYGNKSSSLIRNYALSLGYEYISASSAEEYNEVYEKFTSPVMGQKSIVFEVFTNSEEESLALEAIRNIRKTYKGNAKNVAKKVLGGRSVNIIKKALGK
ncbi:thiamine pyrophosphate-binding protein [Enterovibrio sp. Hal110]